MRHFGKQNEIPCCSSMIQTLSCSPKTTAYADNTFLPFARLLANTFLPLAVLILLRNPCTLERDLFFGWNVIFIFLFHLLNKLLYMQYTENLFYFINKNNEPIILSNLLFVKLFLLFHKELTICGYFYPQHFFLWIYFKKLSTFC